MLRLFFLRCLDLRWCPVGDSNPYEGVMLWYNEECMRMYGMVKQSVEWCVPLKDDHRIVRLLIAPER
jgi:hypothetical protein